MQTEGMDIRIKRVYENASPEDGYRVLIDRLWPRGVSKVDARLDEWAKDVAPSPDLRKEWHSDPDGNDPDHFAAFASDYRKELLGDSKEAFDKLLEAADEHQPLTLLYGARDPKINHAVVLRDLLISRWEDTR